MRIAAEINELQGILSRGLLHRNWENHRQLLRRPKSHAVNDCLPLGIDEARENSRGLYKFDRSTEAAHKLDLGVRQQRGAVDAVQLEKADDGFFDEIVWAARTGRDADH